MANTEKSLLDVPALVVFAPLAAVIAVLVGVGWLLVLGYRVFWVPRHPQTKSRHAAW